MYRGKTISVVIPCYNEQEGLARVIPSLPKSIDEISSPITTRPTARRRSRGSLGARGRIRGAKRVRRGVQGGACRGHGGDHGHHGRRRHLSGRSDGGMRRVSLDRDSIFVNASRFPLEDAERDDVPNRVGNADSHLRDACPFHAAGSRIRSRECGSSAARSTGDRAEERRHGRSARRSRSGQSGIRARDSVNATSGTALGSAR